MAVPLTLSSVPAQTPYVQYVSSASQTVFPYPFEITQDSDLVCLINGVAQPTDGGYTLSGQGSTNGGNLTFTVGQTAGTIITLYRNISIQRITQLSQNGTFFSANFNNEFNKIYLIMQQLQNSLLPGGVSAYALMIPNSNNPSATTLLTPAAYANKYLSFDSNGNPQPTTLTSSGAITAPIITALLYPENAAETAASAVIVNTAYLPQYLLRYNTNSVPGTSDVTTALQNAIDSATTTSPTVGWGNVAAISQPLLIRTTTQENITFTGSARVAAALEPLNTSLSTSPQNINCLIFNQNNNNHLHLSQFEFSSVAAYTGICIYCVNGGGGDSSAKTLFSAVFRDIWYGMPVTAQGFLQGTMQNCKVNTMEVESCVNAVFRLSGTGNQDIFLTDMVMYNCYDQFILQNDDTHGSYNVTVNGLHAYNHNRGPLFNVQNWGSCLVDGVDLQIAASGATTTGIGNFTNCSGVKVCNFNAMPVLSYGTCSTGFILSGNTAFKLFNGQVSAAVGVQLTGASAIDMDFENVDFTTCSTACMQISDVGITGTLRTRNCKFNNSQVSGILDSVGINFTWLSYNDEFINAGLGGATSSANLNLAPTASGAVYLYNPRIGQNNVSAASNYYVLNSGAGNVYIYDPQWVGTPPTGYVNNTGAGSIVVAVQPGYGGTVASATALTLPVNGDSITVSGTTSITSITGSTFNFPGRKMTIIFSGSLTFTSGNNLKLNSNYSTSANSSISLTYDGTNWNETGRGK